MSANDKLATIETPPATTDEIQHGIEQTRANMQATIGEIEARLAPRDLKEQAIEGIDEVQHKVKEAVREQIDEVQLKVKEAIREQIQETKGQLKAELSEAKGLLKAELTEAKGLLKTEFTEAKDTAKQEIQGAITHAKQSLRDATIGKVETMARQVTDTVVETSDSFVETIKQNPIPAALTGIGLVWLLMNRSSSRRRQERSFSENRNDWQSPTRFADQRGSYGIEGQNRGYDRDYDRTSGRFDSRQEGRVVSALHQAQQSAGHAIDEAQGKVMGLAHQASDKASHLAHQVSDTAGTLAHQITDTASGIAHQASDKASHFAHQVSDTAGNLAHQVTDTTSHLAQQASGAANQLVHQASDKASYLAHQASEAADHAAQQARWAAGEARNQARRAEVRATETMHENPLAVGAVALAVGAVVGLALPRTRREDELMGGLRDHLLEQAQNAAQDAMMGAQHLAERGAEEAKGALSNVHHN